MTDSEIIDDNDLDPLLAAAERMRALLPPGTDDEAEASEWNLFPETARPCTP